MVVDGLSTYNNYFSKDVPDITVSGIRGSNIIFRIYEADSFDSAILEEKYVPDESGRVVIKGVGNFIEQLMGYEDPNNASEIDIQPFHPFSLAFSDKENADYELRLVRVKSCMSKTPFASAAGYCRILSRHRRMTILPGQLLVFSVLFDAVRRSFTLNYSIRYRKGDGVGHVSFDVQLQGSESTCNVERFRMSVGAVLGKMKGAGLPEINEDDVLSINISVLRTSDRLWIESITFKIDMREYVDVTTFLYCNMFGEPELINFLGKNKESIEGDKQFGVIDGNYVGISDRQQDIHTAHSGFVTLIGFRCIVDLTNSPYVYLVDENNAMTRVTIVDYELTRTLNGNFPISASIKYRAACEAEQNVYEMEEGEHYQELFDDTFGNEYD